MTFALLVDLIYQPATNARDMLDTLDLMIQTKKTTRPLDPVIQIRVKTTTATVVTAVASGVTTAPTNHHVNAMVRKRF
jgi:ABC-type transport system substrate-binding protein